MSGRRKKWILLLTGSLVIILAAGLWAFLSVHALPKFDYSIDEWKNEHAEYRENGFSVDAVLRDAGMPAVFLWGPYKPLPKGSYSAQIRYTAEEDQSCYATATGSLADLFAASEGTLSKYFDTLVYQFETLDDIAEFQLIIKYSGRGDFTVHSISITANSNQIKRTAAVIIGLVLLTDGVIWFFERDNAEKKRLLALAGITLLISLPLGVYGIHSGYDLGVHFLRIEAIVQALRSGQFPARISSIALYGLGYPFSIYYNDLFLYFPAVLRLLGFSVTAAWKAYVLAVDLLTVVFAYISFGKIFCSRRTGLILALLYSAASYRLVNVFAHSAAGEFTAQMFLPLLCLGFYRIYEEAPEHPSGVFRNAVLPAFALSGIIGSHMLTTLMTGFVMLLFCLLRIRRTLQKRTLLTLLTAAAMTLLLNAYFLVPFIDYYINNPVKINTIVNRGQLLIQNQGIFFAQLFAFFQNINYDPAAGLYGRMPFTPGIPLMIIFAAGLWLKLRAKQTKAFDLILFLSAFMLFISTNLFPWDLLTIHFAPWRILTQIQSPNRFLVFAILFLTVLGGMILKELQGKKFRMVLIISSVLMALWFASDLINHSRIISIYDTSGVSPAWISAGEYLLPGASLDDPDPSPAGENMDAVEVISRNSHTLSLYCRTDESSGPHSVTAPVYAYKGYAVADTAGNVYPFGTAEDGRIRFELPDGFEGTVITAFWEPLYWRAALWVSILTAVCLTGMCCFGQIRRRIS